MANPPFNQSQWSTPAILNDVRPGNANYRSFAAFLVGEHRWRALQVL
jgi:hypothetical protein